MSPKWSAWLDASRWSVPILKVWGIPLRLHASIVLIVPFLLMDFTAAGFIIFSLLGMLVSITLHELGHCLVAVHKGCGVREILLIFPIGGIARIERMPAKPRDEALMALAGPAVSLLLFVVLFFGGGLLPYPRPVLEIYGRPINLVQLLGLANLVLCIFNLLPASPMDGGRVLCAALTGPLGRSRAALVASLIGRAGALVLLVAGIVAAVRWGVWTLPVIAVFLYFLAGREYRIMQHSRKHGSHASTQHLSEEDWHDRVEIGPPPYARADKHHVGVPIVREHRRGPGPHHHNP
ncbi:MAG: site-2 protease family protein [bacterium]